MGVGAVIEPLVVVSLLFGGTYFNRNTSYKFTWRARRRTQPRPAVASDEEEDVFVDAPGSPGSWASEDALLSSRSSSDSGSHSLLVNMDPTWRKRELQLWGFKRSVVTPNSRQFRDRWFSRVIRKFPFLQEAFYWALIYWVCTFGFSSISSSADGTSPGVSNRSRHNSHDSRRRHS